VLLAERGLREAEEFVGELAHVRDLLANIADERERLFVALFLEDPEPDFHACERRAKFMGGVAEEALLPGDEGFETGGHPVDGMAETAEFVAAGVGELDIEMALGN
jgi:hypothetical protein